MIYVNKSDVSKNFIVTYDGIQPIRIHEALIGSSVQFYGGNIYCSLEFFSERSVLIEAWEFKLLKDLLSEK